MGRSLSGQQEATPVVNLRETVGGFFEGVLLGGPREVKLKRGKGIVYEFGIKDTDLPIQIKDKKSGKYVEAEVNLNDKVSIFAPTALARQLSGAKVGEHVRIVYNGMKTGASGTEYHDFNSEVL